MFRNILKTATEIVLEHQTNERWESVCTMPPPNQGDKHSDIIDEHKRDAEEKLAYSHSIYRGCNIYRSEA